MTDTAADLEKSQGLDPDGVKRVKFESRRYKLVKVLETSANFIGHRSSILLARWFRQAQCLSRSRSDLSGILRLGSSDQSSDICETRHSVVCLFFIS